MQGESNNENFRAVLAAALCLTVFSGCGPNAENTKPASDDKAFLTITDDTGRTVVLPENLNEL